MARAHYYKAINALPGTRKIAATPDRMQLELDKPIVIKCAVEAASRNDGKSGYAELEFAVTTPGQRSGVRYDRHMGD